MQNNFFKNCVKGFVIAALSGVALVFLAGLICMYTEDPRVMIKPLGIAALYLSAIIGGIVAAKINKIQGLLTGSVVGGMFALFVGLLSLILRDGNDKMGFVTVVMFLLIVPAGSVGGFLGVPTKSKRKKYAHTPPRRR